MSNFTDKLKAFLHDPIDKCFEIPSHIQRAKEYAEIIDVSGVDEMNGPDEIASCMERSFLPKSEKYGLRKEHFYQECTEIRHPFSEGKICLPDFDKKKILSEVKTVFENIKTALPQDDKDKFLYLWRNLMEEMFDKFKDLPIGKYIPVLPADTRMPDHSIWEHLKIASAIKAFKDKQNNQLYQDNSLFLFSIGPVQSFISQARKTRDLFMGSFILSYLTFKAIEVVVEKYGPTNIIYPDLYKQPLMDWFLKKKNVEIKNSTEYWIDQPTIPNRFVAMIPITNVNEIKEFAQTIENKVKEAWMDMIKQVLDEFKLYSENEIKNISEKQTKNFPEIYWTAIPFKIGSNDLKVKDLKEFFAEHEIKKWHDLENFISLNAEFPPNIGFQYKLAYSTLEKSMGARKNLRNFEQIEEYDKKCHLCGEREAVICGKKREDEKKETEKIKCKVYLDVEKYGKYISSTEGLCIICFTKRALDKYLVNKFSDKFKDFSFPSTAEISCSDFKEKALKDAKSEFKEYVKTFQDIVGEENFKQVKVSFIPKLKEQNSNIENLEGYWFYEENLRVKEFEEQFGITPGEEQLNELKKKLKIITNKIGSPSPYYAILMLDGDFMGEWLSGERLPSLENAYNTEIWKKLPGEFKNQLKKFTNNKKILTPAIHASISHALRNYSLEFVRNIVEEEHLGKLVYSGGDDVLAFVNLKDLFDVMRKLRAAFSGHIKVVDGKIEVDWSNDTGFVEKDVEKDGRYFLTMGPKASASMGVVIAHYKAPLKIVIDNVRDTEKKAKNLEGKDAFAVSLMKRSGQTIKFACKWIVDNEDILEKIKKVSDYFRHESKPRLSKTFPYKLSKTLNEIKDKEGRFTLSQGIFEAELKRVLARSIENANKDKKKTAINNLFEDISFIFFNSGIGANVDQFIALLEFARFMAKPGD
ncbi:MAG: CRISPR-associated protein Cmr2 [Thermoanaerobacterium sp.]|uniref:Type III-B CRISPR-associated protein Cas10/Cmr2 n=1 Tax=Thermodesulfobacterium commune TaxID=1741 RepID=A0A3B8N5G1_9BACT|nr:type III-B CRISPR-associated protein Cas10/Cmr2 [Thermodesulfobacterium thermophilum]MDI3478002.1 CRISPR-associated protein Cmr2 [Thermoanaerobacterium sp.]MDK2811979.1 CRISPR-associated protein Cmr2 [Petrotoga sp.]HAA83486.1 type III-B CRISPR-associated protein Cas10/Cmr2 [Thermodesulfobacterium commune]HCP10093.1 type III-B CRISPR-associated protein Cas10/Cmr2 [Thermodesulfobacterium commune]